MTPAARYLTTIPPDDDAWTGGASIFPARGEPGTAHMMTWAKWEAGYNSDES